VAFLPRRCRRAHRGDGLKHSRGTREARAAVTWKACHWQRWLKRSRGTCRRVKPAMPIYAPLSSGGARPAMGSVPTPVPSLAVGLVPRPAPASVAVPSPVLAPHMAARWERTREPPA
jgi:hypothetical protein